MKNIFTLLLACVILFPASVFAQCNPAFTFTVNSTTGLVQFTSVNSGAVQHSWSFGDGGSSNIADPSHTYSPGTFTVTHVVIFRSTSDSIPQCVDTAVRTLTVVGSQPCNINSAFSFVRDSVQTNKVYFTNLSSGGNPNTVWHWSFGDGTSSSENSPIHIFPTSGVYNVCLVARNGNQCADDTCAMVQVQAPLCNITVNFSNATDSLHPNVVQFSNLSSPLAPGDSLEWNFGDGHLSSEANPTHTYSNAGTYNVCLLVKRFVNNVVVCGREFCHTISVAPFCNMVPNFVYYTDSTSNPLPAVYNFINTTSPLTTVDSSFWDFGDGSPIVINPNSPFTHSFARPGVYTVCLRVIKMQPGTVNTICERQVCYTVMVDTPQSHCNLQAHFAVRRDSSLFNTFYFTNLTQGLNSTDSIRWTFGDGSFSTAANPVHTYNAAGSYQVCLRVKRAQLAGVAPCVDEYCLSVIVAPQPNNCNLVLNFEDSVVNHTVYFTNLSAPLAATDSIRWDFGDGVFSSETNPVHTYQQPGAYRVCLRVKKTGLNTPAPCVRELCRIITIAPQACNMMVSYTAVRDTSVANPGFTYVFTNTSTGISNIDSTFWSFGDGSPFVYSPSPTVTHTFTTVGTYNVCLLVKKMVPGTNTVACVRESCSRIVVQPTNNCNLVADFAYQIDSVNGGTGTLYQFANTSVPLTGTDSCFWDFGDGSPIVISLQGATHTYANAGTYTVCLLVKKTIPGSTNNLCERRVCKTVLVLGQPNPCHQLQVDFAWQRDSVNNKLVHFINQTNPITTNIFFNWDFGDGSSSMAYNPEHIYAQPGTYTVCLRAQMANCVKDTCKVIVIPPSPIDSCAIRPAFVAQPDSANRRKVYFTNTTVPSTAATYAVWSFGDGSSATGWNVVHHYTMPGHYVVCLTVTQGNRCSRTWCDSIFVPGNVLPPVNCDSFRLELSYRRDNYMPNKLFFFATGNAPVYNQQWVISPAGGGDTVQINQNNPVYVFPDTGLYRVCVKGFFSTNCVKEYCTDVRVYSTSTPSQCLLTAYPNPTHSHVSFNVQLHAPGVISSTIYNMQGMPVMQYTQTGVTGNNLVALGIQNLFPGFYTVRVMYNGRVCFTRFQKI